MAIQDAGPGPWNLARQEMPTGMRAAQEIMQKCGVSAPSANNRAFAKSAKRASIDPGTRSPRWCLHPNRRHIMCAPKQNVPWTGLKNKAHLPMSKPQQTPPPLNNSKVVKQSKHSLRTGSKAWNGLKAQSLFEMPRNTSAKYSKANKTKPTHPCPFVQGTSFFAEHLRRMCWPELWDYTAHFYSLQLPYTSSALM